MVINLELIFTFDPIVLSKLGITEEELKANMSQIIEEVLNDNNTCINIPELCQGMYTYFVMHK